MHTEGPMRAEIKEISLPVSVIGVTQILACLGADPNEANDAHFEGWSVTRYLTVLYA